MEQIRVQVLFTQTDPRTGLSYTDAIYYSLEEFASTPRKAIDAEKKRRFDAWASKLVVEPIKTEPVTEPIKEIINKVK